MYAKDACCMRHAERRGEGEVTKHRGQTLWTPCMQGQWDRLGSEAWGHGRVCRWGDADYWAQTLRKSVVASSILPQRHSSTPHAWYVAAFFEFHCAPKQGHEAVTREQRTVSTG